MPTTKLGLPTITGNANADVVRDLNALANAVDEKVGVADGLATLGTDGKLLNTQVPVQADATTVVKGIVTLSSSVTSTSEDLAATPKAVKSAYDLAAEAKSQANDQKTKWAAVIGSPLLAADTSTVLQSKSQTIKNTLASNLSAKGQSSAGTETLTALVNKVALVNTGKKFANGTGSSNTSNVLSVTGLSFKPTRIILSYTNGTKVYQMIYDFSYRPKSGDGAWLDAQARYAETAPFGFGSINAVSAGVDAWTISTSGFSVVIPHASQGSISWFALE